MDHDITSVVLRDEPFRKKLPAFYTNIIITDLRFNIVTIGQRLLDLFNVKHSEACGKNLSDFGFDETLVARLRERLASGYFEGELISFMKTSKQPIQFEFSGFYLGLVSDCNGYIVLRVEYVSDKAIPCQEPGQDSSYNCGMHQVIAEMAAIRGMIDLLDHKGGDTEFMALLATIKAQAEKLADQLSNMSRYPRR